MVEGANPHVSIPVCHSEGPCKRSLTPASRLRCSACYGVLRFIMESGAKGCEVIVSGKLRAQRAKAMKFKVHLLTDLGALSGKSTRQCPFLLPHGRYHSCMLCNRRMGT